MRTLAALAALVLTSTLLVPAAAASAGETGANAAAAAPVFDRIEGTTTTSIAVQASERMFPTGLSGGTVVVAAKEGFQAGFAAASAAAALGGPLLLVTQSSVPAAVRAELVRLAPARIVVVGSTKSLSAAVMTSLKGIQPNTVRVAGSDYYLDAEALARAAHPAGVDHVVIASSTISPDTASAASLAAEDTSPLLFVRKADKAPRATITALLAQLGVERVTIVGGTGSVSAKFQSALSTAGYTVDRVVGSNRYVTSAAAAAAYGTPSTALIVSGNYAGTAVGIIPLAAQLHAPVVLAVPYCRSAALNDYLEANAIAEPIVVGARAIVRELLVTGEECRSLTTASSLWVVANKKNKLDPVTYVPGGLRVPNIQRTGSHSVTGATASALEALAAGSRAAGAGRIGIVSGYRSYSTQQALYARYVRTNGQKWADSQSARAGFSEHQTGLAADVSACSASSCGSIYNFGATAQGKWVKANAYKYGFVVRYEPGYTSTTGYASEPWHLRYVGTALATEYQAGGFHTLESYFGYPAAPGY